MPQPRQNVSDTLLLPGLLDHVKRRLSKGGRVVRALPYNGRMMIDRPLPFLCIHRSENGEFEAGVDQIVRAQTAYLRVSSDPALAGEVRILIEAVQASVKEVTPAFLLLEFWAADPQVNSHTFKVLGPLNNSPETAEELEKGMRDIVTRWRRAKLEMIDSNERHPPHAALLFELEELKKKGILLIGIEVPQIYRGSNGELSGIALRRLRDRFTDVIKRTVHAFARLQAPQRYEHHLMLGRTRFSRLAINVDKALARISSSFDLLLNVSPVNTEEAWHQFRQEHYQKKPDLHYRLISVDHEKIKRELYDLRIDEMEDTTLQAIFRSKRAELDTQATLLSERGRKSFLYSGLRLYGGVNDEIRAQALNIINTVDRSGSETSAKMNAERFLQLVQEELDHYAPLFPGTPLQVRMSNEIPGVMVSKNTVLLGERFTVEQDNARSLLHHEVGTHILTYANGQRQPFHQLYVGMAGYEELQEGLAVMAEFLTGGLSASRLKLLAGRVLAVHALIQGADYVECFSMLEKEHGFAARSAFNITTRVYRGGGFPKDAVYLKGLNALIGHLDGSAEGIELFFTGKFALQHLPLISDLHHRRVLKEPVLPLYLHGEALDRVKYLRKGMDLASLLNI
jgi:uncharacterized protein (TIGR02421 family)